MLELDNFYNAGFGWICRHCELELAAEGAAESSRLWAEGEAESKQPQMSNLALAQWTNKLRTTLVCPRCRITEPADKS